MGFQQVKTYLIGDVQGCFDSLQKLLAHIHFNPLQDRLGFAGDLVNRGPKSLETMRFIRTLTHPIIVLGNHDLHLLALYFLKNDPVFSLKHHHTLQAILDAADCEATIDFLLAQPFIHIDHKKKFLMSHAGIPPQWTIDEALDHADYAAKIMRQDPVLFFKMIYGNEPASWSNTLTGWDRLRYSVNALTRMRHCTKTGTLDLQNTKAHSAHPDYHPWFTWYAMDYDIFFGHWASLEGKCDQPHVYALDTGCGWGRALTGVQVESKQRYHIAACEK